MSLNDSLEEIFIIIIIQEINEFIVQMLVLLKYIAKLYL
jgi:hypothetical protein